MMQLQLQQLAKPLSATVRGNAQFERVSTDSRQLCAADLFVALRGEHFDGHDFIAQAEAAGASAAMVDRRWLLEAGDAAISLPLLIVDDTQRGLGALAAYWRARHDVVLIAVTGSNGKTTVKEMCAAILYAHARQSGAPIESVLATSGNYNNAIGLPLTLLQLQPEHRMAVVELGMNQPGEIAYLTSLARPDVAVLTNAQRAHLQGMHSVDAIAREKGEIFKGLGSGGVAVVNGDDEWAEYWQALNAGKGKRVIHFGMTAKSEVFAKCECHGLGLQMQLTTPEGEIAIELQVPGQHNACNALAAAAACLGAGVSLSAVAVGLNSYVGIAGRLMKLPGQYGATVLDDSYNANPDSVRAAIDVLAATPGKKILVLGDMAEVGETAAQLHDEIGGYAKSKGVDTLFTLGKLSNVAAHNFGAGARHFQTVVSLVHALLPQLGDNTVVLVKGSRCMKMEEVVALLREPLSADVAVTAVREG